MKFIYDFSLKRLVFAVLLICLFMLGNKSFAQVPTKITVIGTVTDSLNVKIPGVSIVVEGSPKIGTVTDNNGKFILEVNNGVTLKISYIGYKEQRVAVTSGIKALNIVLIEDSFMGDEVVITAMGQKQRKEALVGSVTAIKAENLKIPASNLTTSLAGQAAGVIAYQRSGQPGQDNASFFIRGVTTFGYKQDPLILIDNVELTPNDLARLQVDDIASFVILKDASATALYGARGANGVILVSTKEGKEGKAKINFRSEYSISQSTQTLDLVDPITYMDMYNEASLTRNPALPIPFTQTKIDNTKATIAGAPGSNPYVYPAVDWMDMLFKDRATTQRNNLSVSGGGATAKYYIAGAYNIDNGIFKTDIRNNNNNNVNFKNYQLRSNINVNMTRTTEMVIRLSGTFSDYNGPITLDGSFDTDLYAVASHASPVLFPAYYPATGANIGSNHILFGNVGGPNGTATNDIIYPNGNPYAQLLKGHTNSSESRMSAQFEVNQNFDFITEGLKLRAMFNANRRSFFGSKQYYSPYFYSVGSYDKQANTYDLTWLNPTNLTGTPNIPTEYLLYDAGYNPQGMQAESFVYLQGALDYNRTFKENHTISSTLIGIRQQRLYASDNLYNSLPFRNLGLSGRLTYSYKGRYFTEFNFGYNGTERFSESHRYGFFPTIGAAWVVSNEGFWKQNNIVNRLKLRISHGLVGNDAIGDERFYYVSRVNLSGGNFAQFGINNTKQLNGVTILSYPNPNITWETSRQTNFAAEATLFKNFNVIAEFYKNHRYDILRERNIPATEGLETKVLTNLGVVDSKGIDLSVDYKQNFSNGLWASTRGNFTYSTNKYTYVEEPNYAEKWRSLIGQPISRGYGYIAERLFVDDDEVSNSPTQIFTTTDAYDAKIVGSPARAGDIKYRDMNGDGRIDELDMVFLGYPTTPEIVYGFGLSTGYKGFDLSAFFQGQARVSFFINPKTTSPFLDRQVKYVDGRTQVLQAFANSHWSEENQDLYATYPRLGTSSAVLANNLQPSSWWLRDGSFIRLKSVEIGYTLPQKISNRLKLSNCRIYFNGLNLVTWSRFKMWDPELGGNGFNYPIQKVFNFGLNVNL